MRVIIMRGLPGSGKSWWTDNIFRQYKEGEVEICSADHAFYTGPNGAYEFKAEKLGEAHLLCQKKFHSLLACEAKEVQAEKIQVQCLVVDNTNVRLWEMAYYVGLSRVFGIEPEIVHVVAPYWACIRRNVHGVPAEVIKRMAKEWEETPAHFGKVSKVFSDISEYMEVR